MAPSRPAPLCQLQRAVRFALLVHNDDDIPLFVPCFHIAMSFGNAFQWIASIYDRLELSRLNELSEEDEIFFSLFEARGRKDGFFATDL